MNLTEVRALADAMAPAIALAVKQATSPLLLRIAELEARASTPALDDAAIGERIVHAVRAAVAELPVPRDGKDGVDGAPGRDGADGKDGEKGEPGRDGQDAPAITPQNVERAVEAILMVEGAEVRPIAAAVERWMEAHPPEAGKNGRDGIDGKDAPAVDEAVIEAAVTRHLELNPPASGRDGKDGRDGTDGEKGQDGRDGKDGTGLAGALIDKSGALVVTLTDGTMRELGPVVGRDGRDGIDGKDGKRGLDGKDGLEPDAILLGWGEDGRTLTAKFVYGETAMVVEAEGEPAPFCIDRGVFKAEGAYEKGDGVSWAGSFWIAQRATSAKPDASDDWRLAVKRGRDGKDGLPGKDGSEGKAGPPGRDGQPWA